jgi:hypothetical protein
MMVGSYFYLWTKSNWDYTQMYSSIYDRAIARFTRGKKYDVEKEKALEKYVEKIEAHLQLFEQR